MLYRKTLAVAVILLFSFATAPLYAAPTFPNGTLLKGGLAEVFLMTDDNTLRWIPNETTFNSLGYKWTDIVAIDNEVLNQYKFGETLSAVVPNTTLPTAVEVEAQVRRLFADAPIMISVAKCESGFNQFRSDGSLVRNPNGLYVGVFQIDEKIHSAYALSLGMDIKTVEGNLAYARRLYDQKGVQPWSGCAPTSPSISKTLKLGDRGPEVKTLQIALNKAGYIIAPTGPGSPGYETDYFGSLTREAVRKFQCNKILICSGDETTTGYGLVGSRTQAALAVYN